jgi:FkbM family methyltransferase
MLEKIKQPLRDLREHFWSARDLLKKQLFVSKKKLRRISMGNYLLYSRLAAHILSKNDFTIVDVGANDGWFAYIIFSFAPKARVISYEPLPTHNNDLYLLAESNPNFKYHNKAVGDKKDRKTLYEMSTDGLSSIKEKVSGAYDDTFEAKVVNKYDVDVVTLDSEFAHVLNVAGDSKKLLIKIDVQGYEKEVLLGAEKLFKSEKIACIIIELCTAAKYEGQILAPDIIEYMTKRGFEIFDIYPSYYEKTTGQLTEFDAVFINKKLCKIK